MNEQEILEALDKEAQPKPPPSSKAIDQPGILEALVAIRAEAYRMEKEEYQLVSVRSLAKKLGFEDKTDLILQACVDGGFYYCLDHTVAIRTTEENGGSMEFPHRDVCWWGADQLRSRLDWVDSRLRP